MDVDRLLELLAVILGEGVQTISVWPTDTIDRAISGSVGRLEP